MSAPLPKPVHELGATIGNARSWADVVALLVDRGRSARDANDVVRTRGVEGPGGFYIITPATVEQMVAEVRAARASG